MSVVKRSMKMGRIPPSTKSYAMLTRWRLRAVRRLARGASPSIAAVAGLLIFAADAFVAPAYGLNVLYIVLLIAMIPCASRRQVAWMTGSFIALSALGFMIGEGRMASGADIARLLINLVALVLTAVLIVSLRGGTKGFFKGRAGPSEQADPRGDAERVALPVGACATVAIADEVVQQLTATILGNAACRNWLARPLPDIGEAHAAIEDSLASARRASELVQRLRQLRPQPMRIAVPLSPSGLDPG